MGFDCEFRTVFFGGYNKEDVRIYLEEAEKKSELSILRYEKEIVGMKNKIKNLQEEKAFLEEILKEHKLNQNVNKEVHHLEEPFLNDLQNEEFLVEETGFHRIDDGLKSNENRMLRKIIADLEQEKLLLVKEKKDMKKELEELRIRNDYIETSSKNELKASVLQEKDENDFKVIAKVLEDARLNARYIEDSAHQRAEKIIEQARIESQEYVERKKMQIDKELENKGIRLMAAKYKIDAYRSEISNTQQKLFELCSDMEKMVKEMPQRLDQLWEDENSLAVCDKQITDTKH